MAVASLVVVLASAVIGRATVIHVPADYTTIQAAVNAANSGDEIQIAPGVYTNQVVITNKNLTLSGSPGTVLRATPGMQQSLMPIVGTSAVVVPLVAIFESTNVVISGLTLEGERLADNQPGPFIGIRFLAAGGRVEDCRITGFRGTNIASPNGGQGVAIANPQRFGVGQMNLDILRSTFADNAISVVLRGDVPSPPDPSWDPGLLSTTFAVDDNIIIGNGPNTNGTQSGIFIWAGAGGEVKRNTITDHAYTGTTFPPFSFGILAEDGADFNQGKPLAALQPVRFEGNILRDNQVDLLLVRGDENTIVNNSFEGTAPGYRPGGLLLSGENVLVGTNRLSDMDTGIVLIGDDPDFGTFFGVASNAVLSANGFCNVATNYVYEPLTTYDVQSTLGCLDPTLDIQAVQLSWPYSYSGYSVESAPALDGPWTPSDAAVYMQGGQNTAVIPANSDQQYFRLVKP